MNTDLRIQLNLDFILKVITLCLMCMTPHFLPAQTDTAPANESSAATVENVEAPVENGQTILDMFKNGGWAMYPLGLLSIAALGLIVYNFLVVNANRLSTSYNYRHYRCPKSARRKARSICSENTAPATNIIHAGLARADISQYDGNAIKEAIEILPLKNWRALMYSSITYQLSDH